MDRFQQARSKKYKKEIEERSRHWGQKKFTPKPYSGTVPPPKNDSKPWQHVKSEILDDEQEVRNSERINMNSQGAKDIIKQRERNHRRNVIETKRGEATTWETFGEEGSITKADVSRAPRTSSKKMKPKKTIDPNNLTFEDRNFLRKKLTRAICTKQGKNSLENAIVDMQRNNVVAPWNKFRDNKKFRD